MEKTPEPPRRALRIDISPRTIGGLLLAGAAIWLLVQLWTVVLLVVVALVLVGTFSPVVCWLERHNLRRGHALVVLFLALLILVSGVLLLTVPPLVDQLMAIIDDAPASRERVATWLEERPLTAPLADSIRDTISEESIARLGNHLLGYSSQVIQGIGYAVTTLFLAFYLLSDGKHAKGVLYAVVPRHYHLRLSRIMLNLETIVGGYMRGQLITSLAITAFTFALLTVLQVPNALSLAVLAGLTDVIPFIGGLLATVPAVLGATARGPVIAIVVLATLFVYQEFESRILVPRVYGRTLRLSPTVVLLALLIGGTLLGIIGALLALPIAAGLQMIGRELRVEMPGDDSRNPAREARDEAAEVRYEHQSAGATPEQAAVIATELTQQRRSAGLTQELQELPDGTLPP